MSVWGPTTSLWLAASLTLFCGWCVRVHAKTELSRESRRTDRLIWHFGQYAVWTAAGLAALLAFTMAAYVCARAIVG
jgi:magnesium-transporting ATPase (P-type)